MLNTASKTLTNRRPHPRAITGAQPFENAESAWLWTMAALIARREGARYTANKGPFIRPCDPDDIVKCLDGLYRQQRISLGHARILRIWGERQIAPSAILSAERADRKLWVEALEKWQGRFGPKV